MLRLPHRGCCDPSTLGPGISHRQRRWRRLNGAHLLPLVRAGVRFVDGLPQPRDETEMEARKEAACTPELPIHNI